MNANVLALSLSMLLLALPLAAEDLGESIVFEGAHAVALEEELSAVAAPNGDVVFEGGPSAAQNAENDTVIFHGEMTGPDVRFEVARMRDDGTWSPWSQASVKRYPHGRFWAKAAVPLGKGSLRLRAVGKKVSAKKIKIYSVEAFQASDRETPRGGRATTPPPAMPRPVVHGRAEWKAAVPKDDYEPQTPDRITMHHSDGKYTSTLDETLQEVKLIQDFHIHGRGWNDIAYHYLIDSAGNIVEGRPELVVGAHAGDHDKNLNNIGIVFLGTYHEPKNDPVTQAELDQFVAISRYLVARYKMKPNTLKGHRDYKSTDCPGDLLYAKRDALRKLLAAPPAPARPSVLFRPLAVVAPRFE